MTLTVDLPAADEAALRELLQAPPQARRAALQEARRVASEYSDADEEACNRDERRAAIDRLKGKYRYVPGSVDEFLRERREEALEDERKIVTN